MLESIKIGRQIALLRKEKGLTGEKLAEILNVSPQAVSKWENGKSLPETALLPALANTLDCSIDVLLNPKDKSEAKMEDNEKVKEFYESVNEDGREAYHSLEFARSRIIIERYLFDNQMEIADVGGGTGVYAFWLAGMGHRVHLLDLTQKHISIAKQKSKASNIDLASYICADARSLPYEDESMDIVLVMGALYHFQTLESRIKCLAEAFRVLKNGSHVICTVLCRYNIPTSTIKWNLFYKFGMGLIEKMLKTGMGGGFSLPMAYAHTPGGITEELTGAGLKDISTVAVEGIANPFGDTRLPADEKEAAQLLKCIELMESTPELIGISRNIIAVGKK